MPQDPAQLAADYLRSRIPVATPLSAQEIAEHVPQALRDSAIFSARTIWADHIADTQRDIVRLLAPAVDPETGRAVPGATPNPVEIRARMKQRLARLGYQPEAALKGGLQDLSSDMRTNLIISMQESRARGYAVWRSHQDADVMRVWPAQEFFRAYSRDKPRNWRERWNGERGALGPDRTTATYATNFYGPFIALKNDPIWEAISRFGSPHPPFDYQSGMRLRNVDAASARAAGVLGPDQPPPEPRRDPMRQVQSSSTAGMAPEVVRAWAAAFGDRAKVYGNRIAVAPDPSVIGEVIEAAQAGLQARATFGFVPETQRLAINAALPRPLPLETALAIDADEVRHIFAGHGAEPRAGQRNVTAADIEAIPATLAAGGRWRPSTQQERGTYQGDAITFIGRLGAQIAWRLHRHKTAPRLSVHTLHIQTR